MEEQGKADELYEGKYVRENASLFDTLFYNYAKPFLDYP